MRKILLILATFLLLSALPAYAITTWEGTVLAVNEGDTLVVDHYGEPELVTLYGISCPTKGEDFGPLAKVFTNDLLMGKKVIVEEQIRPAGNPTQALVYVKDTGLLLNKTLVKVGYAWVYDGRCEKAECINWYTLEHEARNAQRGIWFATSSESELPQAPWKYHWDITR